MKIEFESIPLPDGTEVLQAVCTSEAEAMDAWAQLSKRADRIGEPQRRTRPGNPPAIIVAALTSGGYGAIQRGLNYKKPYSEGGKF